LILRKSIITLLTVTVLASGCATVEKTALSSDSKKKIKTIAMISVAEPGKYFLDPGQVPGGAALYAFGALGGLILGGIEASRAENATNEFTAAVKPTNPDVARHWNESVSILLQGRGYEVTQLPELPKKTDGKELDCSSIAGKYDAVLLSNISTGYAVESNVEPRVGAFVRLTSANCTDTHFTDSYIYSAKPIGKLTHLERDSKFTFSSRDSLLADPQTARLALRTGLTEIAKRLTSEF
jgi:hypothetical protein